MPQDDVVHFDRYSDVVQALLNPQLVPPGSVNTVAAPLGDPRFAPSSAASTGSGTAPHAAMRAAVHQALAPAQLAIWRDAFAAQAQALVAALPDGKPVDLVTALAEPWSLGLTLAVTGVPQKRAAECASLARRIYLAAANARDGRSPPDGLAAATALAQALAQALAGLPSRPAAIADVQTFVALSQTLPALLAGAWRALLAQPEALAKLLLQPQRVAGCVGELLRLGSPARAVFRQAAQDLNIGPHRLRRGDTVALLIGAANRDPTQFPDPERLDLNGHTSAQLGLGLGLHHCAGASLVRMALIVGTQALLEGCTSLALVDAADIAETATLWRGGFALCAPASLFVVRKP